MSDRAATEKKFYELLEIYRKEILPLVKDGWEDMREEERMACSKMHNFLCGLHLLVGFADVCAEALRTCETLHAADNEAGIAKENDQQRKEESGTIQLIRAASKVFAKGADEKSGVFADWKLYIESHGEKCCS
jgi:hypothetical protein